MSVRDLDDDLRTDVPQLMARLGVELPRLFEDDGTPTTVIRPLGVPDGVTLTDAMIGGWDFDGDLGDAGTLRIAGLRLSKLGYYIADDDPARSAASALHGRIPRWPTSLEEVVAQDEAATLPSASALAMMRRVNCTIRDISIAKDVLRAGGTLCAVMIAALQASQAFDVAATARDVANMALYEQQPADTAERLFTAAQNHVVLTGQHCVTLLGLLDRHRLATAAIATAPHGHGAHRPRRNVGDARRVMDATSRAVLELARKLGGYAPSAGIRYRLKRTSAALEFARRVITAITGYIGLDRDDPDGCWTALFGSIAPTKEERNKYSDSDTAIALVRPRLDHVARALRFDDTARASAIAAITGVDTTRLFMLLHSARIGEAVTLFPWLAARHDGFPDFPCGFADAVTVLLELQRCHAILRELVLRTRGPLEQLGDQGAIPVEPRLTIPEARRAFATSPKMEAALASHHGFATYAREFSLARATYEAYNKGQPLDPGHPLPVLIQGSTDWTAGQAYRSPATIATTTAALAASAVVTKTNRERQDLPRFYGMTAIEFITASLQTILDAHRRGPHALKKRGETQTIDIDESLFKLARLMLGAVDPSGGEVVRLDKRARGATGGTGAARLGQAMINAHKPARRRTLEERLRAGAATLPIWLVMRAGYDSALFEAPAADQCVPAYWYNPEHDLPFWAAFQQAVKQPGAPSRMGPPATQRDALVLKLVAFKASAPRLVARLLPTPQTARVVTWLAHGFIGIATDPELAAL